MDRRNFIREIGVMGGSGLLLSAFPWLKASSAETQNDVKKEKVKIAIIGTGSRGLYHLHNIKLIKQAEVVAVCDVFESHLNDAKELFPKATGYKDYRKLLERKDIQGVIITTPLHVHAEITIAALQAGKHVFCEKSMARTIADSYKMYQTHKETGNVLYIGQQRLFDRKYLKTMEMIHAGVIGDIVSMRAYWFRNKDWRRPVPSAELERQINWRLYKEYSAGLLTELAAHQVQVGNWAMRSIPEKVMGSGDIIYWKDGREVYDSVNLIYHYPNGVKMTYESVIANKFFGLEEEILGSKGTFMPEKGKYYYEKVQPAPGIQQLVNQVEHKIFDNAPIAGPSWVPETAQKNQAFYVEDKVSSTLGASSVGAMDDGSFQLLEAFCHSAITGEQPANLLEEAYYATVLVLLGEQAIVEQKVLSMPEEYKINYLNM